MKNNFKLILALCFLVSCGNNSGSKNVNIPDNFRSENFIHNKNKLQKIVTKEMVAKAVDIPADKIQQRIENNIHSKEQYTLLYSWQTGDKKKVGNGKFKIDEYHSMSIGFVRQMNPTEFEQYYGTNEGLQMQVDEIVEQKNFNKEIGTAEAGYIAEYARYRKTEKIESVATLAFWETPMNAIHVLAKDVAFTITANFGDNESTAKQKAITLTQVILNP